MSLNWTVISQVVSATGVLIAAISLLVGVSRYRDAKRREYVYALRSTIFFSKPTCKTLLRLLSFDYAYEIASSIAHSDTMRVALHEVYHRYFYPQESSHTEPKGQLRRKDSNYPLEQYFEDEFPTTLLVPIHTELVQTFDKLTSSLGQRVEPYRFDYPSLTRVVSTVYNFFIDFETQYRNYVRDQEAWKDAIRAYAQDESETAKVNSVLELQSKLAQLIVAQWYQDKFEQQAKTLRDLVNIEDIVAAGYLSKPNAELLDIGRKEARIKFVNPEELVDPSDNLREASKGLEFVLSPSDMQKYHHLVERIGDRGT